MNLFDSTSQFARFLNYHTITRCNFSKTMLLALRKNLKNVVSDVIFGTVLFVKEVIVETSRLIPAVKQITEYL